MLAIKPYPIRDFEHALGPRFDTAERPEGQWVLFEEERQVHPLRDAGALAGKARAGSREGKSVQVIP
jgi:hypothetical protein